MECLGDVRVCQKRQILGERLEVVDRKLDLLVGELRRYGVSVGSGGQVVWEGCLASSWRFATLSTIQVGCRGFIELEQQPLLPFVLAPTSLNLKCRRH